MHNARATQLRSSLKLNARRRNAIARGVVAPPLTKAADAHSRRPMAALACVLCSVLLSQPALAFDGDGASSFVSRGCVGCHAVGGNVVVPSATLFANDLTRNGLTTLDDVRRVIELGRGKMPGYGEACAPKGACTFGARLDAGEIDALASFVLERAANDWK